MSKSEKMRRSWCERQRVVWSCDYTPKYAYQVHPEQQSRYGRQNVEIVFTEGSECCVLFRVISEYKEVTMILGPDQARDLGQKLAEAGERGERARIEANAREKGASDE